MGRSTKLKLSLFLVIRFPPTHCEALLTALIFTTRRPGSASSVVLKRNGCRNPTARSQWVSGQFAFVVVVVVVVVLVVVLVLVLVLVDVAVLVLVVVIVIAVVVVAVFTVFFVS